MLMIWTLYLLQGVNREESSSDNLNCKFWLLLFILKIVLISCFDFVLFQVCVSEILIVVKCL